MLTTLAYGGEGLHFSAFILASDRKSSHLIPSWQDCDVLDSITGALKPLKGITDVITGEKG